MNPQINYLLQLSIQHIQADRLEDAERLLQKILKMQPRHADCLCFLSVIAARKSDWTTALNLINNSIKSASNNAVAFNNRGNILKELGRYIESIQSYEKALVLEPNYEEAYNNLGNVYQEVGKYSEAVVMYEKAIAIAPNYAEAYSNKGNALQKLGYFQDSLPLYDLAIAIKPEYLEAWAYRGLTLTKIKRFEEALSSYKTAISINPKHAGVWNLMGLLSSDTGEYEHAVTYFDKAIELDSKFVPAWVNRGLALFDLKEYDKALISYKIAAELDDSQDYVLDHLVYAKLFIADWSGLDSNLEEVINRIKINKKVILPFTFLAARDSSKYALAVSKIWVDSVHSAKDTLPSCTKRSHQKIRIAYFSPDFKNHPVSLLSAELFELHDRDRFEVYAFSLKKAPEGDQMRPRLMRGFDHFIDVENLSDLEIAKLARDLEIDIAVDLAGHTKNGPTEVFSYRAAPIQVNYLGYPGTLGADYIDYIIADKVVIPENHQQYFTERIVYLPNCFMVDDSKRGPSTRKFTKEELGLPPNKFIFCCFNNSFKFNKKILQSWAAILFASNESVIWIPENNELFRENILREFKALKIDPSRIIFARKVNSMGDHLARLGLADLFLDTLPFNAHTTAIDALKSGLPILTCPGEAFAGRVAASLLNAIGVPELIAGTTEQYETMAIDFAMNPDKLNILKKKIHSTSSMHPLFDSNLFVKNIEAAYLEMYKRYLEDQPLEHIYI